MKKDRRVYPGRGKSVAALGIGLVLLVKIFPLQAESPIPRPCPVPLSTSEPPYADSLGVRLLGRSLHGSSFCTAVRGDRVYVGAGSSLMCFDVSDPSDPLLLGFLRTEAKIWNIFFLGDTAFVANDKEGLTIVDCRWPDALGKLGSFGIEPGAIAYGVYARNDTAWVACGAGGILAIDCRNPSAPSLVGEYNPWGLGIFTHIAVDVSVLGSLAFVAYADVFMGATPLMAAGLGILDCSDPTAIDTIGVHSLGTNGSPRALFATEDTLVCVAGGLKDLFIFDCSNPDSAKVISTFTTEPMDTNYSIDVCVEDGLIYLGDGYAWTDNLLFFGLPGPDSIMEPVESLQTRNIAWGLSVEDSIVYIAEEWGGLSVADCTDPRNPVILARRDIGGYALGVSLVGPLAYVACEGAGLQVVDCEDPHQAGLVSTFDTRGRACSIWMKNDTAYVAEGFDWVQGPSGLEVVDFTDLGNPLLLGSYNPGDSIEFTDIHMAGNKAYIANGINGLHILDCSDPKNPHSIATYDVDPEDTVKARDIFVKGSTAYLAYDRYGVWLFDSSNPYSPVPLGHIDTPTPAMGIHVRGDWAYAVCAQTLLEKGSLRIFDCSDPDSIWEMGSCETEGNPERVTVTGNLAYVASGMGGLRIFDCSSPFQPNEIAYYATADRATDLAVRGDTIYVTDSAGGLFILEFTELGISEKGGTHSSDQPRASMLFQNFPNPFNPATVIPYCLPRDGHVELAVYNIMGRRMRTLVEEHGTAGEHQVSWDGRDEWGERVASGIYFLRLREGDSVEVRKMLLLR